LHRTFKMDNSLNQPDSSSAEEKILEAARKVFTARGYAATRTRDIAQKAGINLALLNYYFRSKEKLFALVMQEKMKQMFGSVLNIVNDPATSLENKVEKLVSNYTDLLLLNPDLPIFVLSELRNNPDHLLGKMAENNPLINSHFIKQIKEKRPEVNPFQLLITLLGMTIFPFVAKPMLLKLGNLNDESYKFLIEERRTLITLWMQTILDVPVKL
jgi:AcrR family transcriptional regulator